MISAQTHIIARFIDCADLSRQSCAGNGARSMKTHEPTPIRFGDAALAQLVEHRIRNAGVRGSNPLSGTITLTLVKSRLLLELPNRGRACLQ
tara:strand:- start:316 stop:591 length:276 start_codon:yes stop_codon:yes gene_type:complete